MRRRGRPRHPDILTPREWEVLALLRQDRSNEEIAESLGVTLATARFHVSEIISKLGVANRYEAAVWHPQPASRRSARAWALAPFAAARHLRWGTVGIAVGAAATAAALLVVALLVWGAGRTFTFPASQSDASAICTPGPTLTPLSTRDLIQLRTPRPPDLRPDSTRQAEIEAGAQRNLEWTNRFIAAGCDPHALPDLGVEQFQGVGYVNPDQAIADANVIVRAHVDQTTFTASRDRQSVQQSAHSSLTVIESLKGDAPATLALNEFGGPVPQLDWGALMHIDGRPLVLAGDDVILLLKQDRSKGAAAAVYSQLNYVGVYYVRDGLVYAGHRNPCAWAIDGTPLRRFTDFLRASIARTASGPVSSVPSCGDFNGAASTTPVPTITPAP